MPTNLRAHPRFTSQEWSILTGVATGVLALVLLAIPAFALPGMATTTPQPVAAWWKFWAVSAGMAVGASVLGNSLWRCRVARRRGRTGSTSPRLKPVEPGVALTRRTHGTPLGGA